MQAKVAFGLSFGSASPHKVTTTLGRENGSQKSLDFGGRETPPRPKELLSRRIGDEVLIAHDAESQWPRGEVRALMSDLR